MKKLLLAIIVSATIGTNQLAAQADYEFAAGLGLDIFSGATLVGPSAKYFFAGEHAGQVDLLFESNLTVIQGLYEYHGDISGAEGLNWYAGGGPSLFFFGNGFGSEVALRALVGLEYKINGVPLAFTFDWRPLIGLGDLGSEAGAFGLGFRYVIQ